MYEVERMVRPHIMPWTEVIGRVMQVDILNDEMKLKIAFQSHVHLTIPQEAIIKKPSTIKPGNSISVLRTHAGYYIKTSLNSNPQAHTEVDLG